MNNETNIVKAKLESKLYSVFKSLLGKKNMAQQEFIESCVKDFVVDNIELVTSTKSDAK